MTCVIGLLMLASAPAWAVPLELGTQGYLADTAGTGLTGTHSLSFALYDDAAGTNPALWSEDHAVAFVDGSYTLVLGTTSPLDAALLDQAPLFVGLSVDGGVDLLPRQPMVSVPYAVLSEQAYSVVGGPVNASSVQAGTTVIDASGITIDGTPVFDAAGALLAPPPAEVDPVFEASAAAGITTGDTSAWTAAAGFGDHAAENYLDGSGGTWTGTLVAAVPGLGTALDLANHGIIGVGVLEMFDTGAGRGLSWPSTAGWTIDVTNAARTSTGGAGGDLWLYGSSGDIRMARPVIAELDLTAKGHVYGQTPFMMGSTTIPSGDLFGDPVVFGWPNVLDPGNDMNGLTGLFTIPRTGFYRLEGNAVFLGSVSMPMGFVVNGVMQMEMEITGPGSQGHSAILRLQQGDTVGLGVSTGGFTQYNVFGSRSFSVLYISDE